MQKRLPLPFLLVFLFIGFYFILIGTFPIEVEINHSDNVSVAKIHRKSMIPPFKEINITVSNLRQAIITTSKDSKGRTNYRVELEDFGGRRFPIIPYRSSGYYDKQILQAQINKCIITKTPFKQIIQQKFMTILGCSFFFVSLIIILLSLKQVINQKEIPNSNQQQRKSKQQFYKMPNTPGQPKPVNEEEKYKDINNSIIK